MDRATSFLLPTSEDKLLTEVYLARIVVESIDQLDISAIEKQYTGVVPTLTHARMMALLLFFSYVTNTFFTR